MLILKTIYKSESQVCWRQLGPCEENGVLTFWLIKFSRFSFLWWFFSGFHSFACPCNVHAMSDTVLGWLLRLIILELGSLGATSHEGVGDGNMEIERDFDATSAALEALHCTVGTRAVLEGDVLDHHLMWLWACGQWLKEWGNKVEMSDVE